MLMTFSLTAIAAITGVGEGHEISHIGCFILGERGEKVLSTCAM